MKDLETSLGKALTAKDLAEYMGVSEKAVRENYQQLGGVRIGRHYRFFTEEVTNALEKRQKIYSADQKERSAQGKGVSHTEGSKNVGSKNEKNVGRRVERHDKHNLLD